MGPCGWIFSHKLLLIFIAATTAFAIATITLAVEKSDLKDELNECQDHPVTSDPGEATTLATTTEKPDMERYRLPRHIVPKSYDLYLYPDLEDKAGAFGGKVIATVDVQTDTTEVWIHSNGLEITKVGIDFGGAAKFEADTTHELLIISLSSGGIIKKGERKITIEYKGIMKDKIVGLYKSTYVNDKGQERAIATTKFEPTYARQAFPCFDEPDMKAAYTVHILKPAGDTSYIALSNMPQEVNEEPVENGVMVHFKPSVKMSTYLACFIVCDFDFTNDVIAIPNSKETIPLRVYATPAQTENTKYALGVAKGVIEYFMDYFKITYPLPKLDLIAIPDFVSGAMEHWGLVTFRETALLFDETKSSPANKQRIATVVSHELAHSWFGNLVTMKWWNDLWLNEGFASYIQYKGVDYVHKDWDMLHQFLIEHLHPVLSLDATPASHPIVKTDVITPDQITEIFDTITYNKGAAVLRMLEGAVSEETFQKGVTKYLENNAYGNAVTEDLWNELQKIVGDKINVKDFMDTWTVQMGYPILTVKEEGGKYVLTQKRFLKDPENAKTSQSPYGYKWTIPVTYITDKNQINPETKWFDYTQESLTIEKPAGIKWLKFNHNQVGYYRVNYNQADWKALAANIKSMVSTSDKTHLLEESFSIAESGDELEYSVPLDLTKYLKDERNYIPWSVAATKLRQLKKYLVDSLQYSNYLNYVQDIVKPAYNEFTWAVPVDDPHLNRRARATVIGLACAMGSVDCKAEALKLFKAWLVDPTKPVQQDVRAIVYEYGMEDGGEDEWEKLLDIFKKEIDASEKLNLMRGLSAVKETYLLKRLIELGRDDTIIRSQDYFTMLQYVSANPIGTPIVWDYVRENWEYLENRFGLNDRYLGRLIPAITSSFTTKTKLNEITAFFKLHPKAGAGEAARQEALANVNNNIKWVTKKKPQVEKWFKENAPSTP